MQLECKYRDRLRVGKLSHISLIGSYLSTSLRICGTLFKLFEGHPWPPDIKTKRKLIEVREEPALPNDSFALSVILNFLL